MPPRSGGTRAKLADLLRGHAKGDTLAASGRLELSRWTGEDGTERESWQMIAVHLHSARTVRPGPEGGPKSRKSPNGGAPGPVQGARAKPQGGPAEPPPFDDALPF